MDRNILYGAMAAICLASPAAARDWVWQDEFKTFERGEVQETVAPKLKKFTDSGTGMLYGQWQYAVAPKGLDVWISEHCSRFIARMEIAKYTNVGKCITTHFLINGRDPGDIDVDDRWLLADLEQEPAKVQALFEAEAQQVVEERQLAEPITWGEAQKLLQKVVIDFNLDEAGQKFVTDEVAQQLEAQSDEFVTDGMVRDALRGVLLENGEELGLSDLTLENVFQTIFERMEAFEERLGDVEEAMNKLPEQLGTSISIEAVPAFFDRVLRETGLNAEISAANAGDARQYVVDEMAETSAAVLSPAELTTLFKVAMQQAGVPSAIMDEEFWDDVAKLFQTRLATVEDQTAANTEGLAEVRSDLNDKADQSTVNDLSDRVGNVEDQVNENSADLADDGWVQNEFAAVWSEINGGSNTQPTGGTNSGWMQTVGILLTLGLTILAIASIVWLALRKPWKKDLTAVTTTANEAKEAATSADTKAGEAGEKAQKAHRLAGRALQEARVATNLGLPDGWTLIGDLPSEEEVQSLDDGGSIPLRFLHETKGDRKAVFTMAKGSIQGPDGNMVDGLLVTGISGQVKPISPKVNNMVGKVRNGIKSNKFVGVDADGKTNGPTSAVA